LSTAETRWNVGLRRWEAARMISAMIRRMQRAEKAIIMPKVVR
jgi:hypothetical protein